MKYSAAPSPPLINLPEFDKCKLLFHVLIVVCIQIASTMVAGVLLLVYSRCQINLQIAERRAFSASQPEQATGPLAENLLYRAGHFRCF